MTGRVYRAAAVRPGWHVYHEEEWALVLVVVETELEADRSRWLRFYCVGHKAPLLVSKDSAVRARPE